MKGCNYSRIIQNLHNPAREASSLIDVNWFLKRINVLNKLAEISNTSEEMALERKEPIRWEKYHFGWMRCVKSELQFRYYNVSPFHKLVLQQKEIKIIITCKEYTSSLKAK